MRLVYCRRTCAALLSGTAALVLVACGPVHSITIARDDHAVHVEEGEHDHHGPPPHAPAHGYRRKQHDAFRHGHDGGDVEIVFDSDLGAYVVVDISGYYYLDGMYLRVEEGRWYASAHLDGDWKPCDDQALPPGLRKNHAKVKENGWPGRIPARHAD